MSVRRCKTAASIAATFALTGGGTAFAGEYFLWASDIEASSTNCWIDESFAEGNPGCAPCPCNDGDYSVSESGGCWLNVLDLQNFNPPAGEQIIGLRMNVMCRYDNSVTGQVRMRVRLNGQDLAIRDSPSFTSNLQCQLRMGDAGDIFNVKSSWSVADINNLQIGVRRINTPGETLRVKGLRVRVITAAGPPITGACCLPNGSCIGNQTASQCAGQGGVYQGDGTSCNGVSCPGSCDGAAGNCCQPNGTPGCNNTACCEAVCAADPFCCEVEWDDLCVEEAEATPVCNCAPPPPGCPGAGDCCQPNGTPGCSNTACCEAVCDLDPFCCETEWDDICVQSTDGIAACNCAPPPPGCPGAGDCCQPNGTPGCSNTACCEAVCAADPFCCEVEWDSICADAAADLPACGCAAEPSCPGGGDCCEANGTPGCNDAACCESVCASDPFCCEVEWDLTCADAAADSAACNCVPLQACCLPSVECIMLSAADCAAAGGSPQGDGSTCAGISCAGLADLDGDGEVGAADLALLLGQWGPCNGCPADLTGDGAVQGDDLAQLLASWG